MKNFDDRDKDWFGEQITEINSSWRECKVDELHRTTEPVVLRGFVADWPSVQVALQSDNELFKYLKKFDSGGIVPVSVGSEELNGRVFYSEDLTRLNVQQGKSRFSTLLDKVLMVGKQNPSKLVYMASVDTDHCVKGFSKLNSLGIEGLDPIVSIWIGTRTRIAAHNDLPLNIACVVGGTRRFTLFPPNQTENLYPGPFEFTPAGRPISLVDFHRPDFEKFPKFRKAIDVARSSVLQPGDAIFIPSMWWHHVEAFGGFNVLVNYWWRTVPRFLGTPQDVLNHAMLTLRDLPENEKQIWRDVFEYYVFGDGSIPAEHVPHEIKGILAPFDEELAKRARSYLVSRLSR